MDFYNSALEEVNRIGVKAIGVTQRTFAGYDNTFHIITEIGNSAHSFTLLIPLAAAVDLQLACNLMVVSIVGEWVNTLMKWLLKEDRPYWWVRETDIYEKYKMTPPVLAQTTHTCETGPGSPSGHVMHTAIIGVVIAYWLIDSYISQSKFPRPYTRRFKIIVWSIYGAVVLSVALSRMYIAAHFPHQCLLGATLGPLVAMVLIHERSPICRWWKNAGRPQLLSAAVLLAVIAVAGYWLQKAFGVDPQWSVKLAFKWCHAVQNLHVSTTNVYSLVRDCGSAVGFALSCPYSRRLVHKQLSVPIGVLAALLLNVTVRSAQKSIPVSSALTFYSAHFFLHAILPILVLYTFPVMKPLPEPQQPRATFVQRTASRPFRQKYD